jgi:hypothetical protein
MELSQSITWLNIEEIIEKTWTIKQTIRWNIKKLLDMWIIEKHSDLKRDKNALYTL